MFHRLTGIDARGRGPARKESLPGLPTWSGALPLWASDRWLWVVREQGGRVRYKQGTAGSAWVDAFDSVSSSPLIVFHDRGRAVAAKGARSVARSILQSGYFMFSARRHRRNSSPLLDRLFPTPGTEHSLWQWLASALEVGGVLYVCGRYDRGLVARLRRLGPDFAAAEWHLIEPGREGQWHLRPARHAMQVVIDGLHPPYGGRAAVAQVRNRWLTGTHSMDCLPVWRVDNGQ